MLVSPPPFFVTNVPCIGLQASQYSSETEQRMRVEKEAKAVSLTRRTSVGGLDDAIVGFERRRSDTETSNQVCVCVCVCVCVWF